MIMLDLLCLNQIHFDYFVNLCLLSQPRKKFQKAFARADRDEDQFLMAVGCYVCRVHIYDWMSITITRRKH